MKNLLKSTGWLGGLLFLAFLVRGDLSHAKRPFFEYKGNYRENLIQQIKGFKGYGQGVGVYHSPVNTRAHFSNLLLTIAQKMGVETKAFADSSGVIYEVLS